MAQKTLHPTPQTVQWKPKKATPSTSDVIPAGVSVSFPRPPTHDTSPNKTAATSYLGVGTAANFEDEDERLWQQEFNSSLDILSNLADEALADYEAGRTTRISA